MRNRSKNRHGLSRRIPDRVKEQVRRECCFGCVICGKFYQAYDHFDPEFAYCTEHNPDGIALLCADCHDKKTHKHHITNEFVAKKKKERINNDIKIDPTWETHYHEDGEARLKLGGCLLRGRKVGVSIGEFNLITISAPEVGDRWDFSGNIVHKDGEVASFDKWDIVVKNSNWDAELIANIFAFYKKDSRCKKRDLVLQFDVSSGVFGIDYMNLQWPSGLTIFTDNREKFGRRIPSIRFANWRYPENKRIPRCIDIGIHEVHAIEQPWVKPVNKTSKTSNIANSSDEYEPFAFSSIENMSCKIRSYDGFANFCSLPGICDILEDWMFRI